MTPNVNDYTLSISQLHENFMREGCPWWKAFRGDRQSEMLGKFRPDNNMARTDEEVLIFSWLQLEDLLKRFPRGYAKIVATKNKTDNKTTAITSYVRWGDVYESATPTIGSAHGGRGLVPATNAAGPSWPELFKIMQDTHSRELKLTKELSATEFLLELREQQLEAKDAPEEPSTQEKLLMRGVGMIESIFTGRPAIAPGRLGLITPGDPQSEISVTGPATSTPQSPPMPTDQPSPPAYRQLSHDQLVRAAQIVDHAIPNHHPNDVFVALAIWCQNNQGMAAGYVDQLISQAQQSQATAQTPHAHG